MKPQALIDGMKPLYYADVVEYREALAGYMFHVPRMFVLVLVPDDSSYCILGTDAQFQNWEQYSNYVFADLKPAMEAPEVIFRIPKFPWKKVN